MLCLCKSGSLYSDCCKSLLLGQKKVNNCEQLMRSRYTAFALGNVSYLIMTSSKDLLTTLNEEDLIETCNNFQFVNLEVLNFKKIDSIQDKSNEVSQNKDTVEFIAHLLSGNEYHKIHERSQFITEDNRLKYDTGLLFDTPIIKLNRNDSCPCLSGKKFKKCHME
jgi:SEC-C motif-containing protein